MKKQIVALMSALLIAAAPAVALAATPSPRVESAPVSVTTPSGAEVSVVASGKMLSDDAYIKIEPAAEGENAANLPAEEKTDVVASFVVTSEGTEPPYSFTYKLGIQYANADVKVYIEHEDGTTEVVNTRADANGSIAFTQDKLSIHTVVAEPTHDAQGNPLSGAASAKTDSSSQSPQTGLFTLAAAGVTVGAGIVAAGAAVALRRR